MRSVGKIEGHELKQGESILGSQVDDFVGTGHQDEKFLPNHIFTKLTK